MSESPHLVITVPQVRELAGEWAQTLNEIAAQMYAYLAERIPEAGEPDVAGLTLASCASNVEAVLSMIRHGIPASATEAPVTALEHARVMAQRGASIDVTLRFYRLGHAFFWERWSATLAHAIDDKDRLALALEETARFVFDYIDVISTRVSAEHTAERERRQRRAAVVRADVVRAVLSGEPVDHRRAEQALGHPLDRAQLAFMCWTAEDSAELEPAAAAIAQTLARGRALMLADGPRALAGWVVPHGRGVDDLDELRSAVSAVAPEVVVAMGEVGTGIEGFRASREQAERARRVAELAGVRSPAVVRYADVALVDLLSRDIDAAHAFVLAELAGLTADDAATVGLREALLAVVAPAGGISAAARALGLHRNTILQRVHRAEGLRGRPASERPAELHAALLLASAFGRVVLDRD